MTRGTTFHGYVPILSEPDHHSPMISQMLFGEEFILLEREANWFRISLNFDHIEGWVAREWVETREAENGEETGVENGIRIASLPSATILDLTLGQQVILPAGAVWNSKGRNSISWYERDFELMSQEGFILPGETADPYEIGKRILSIPQIPGGRSGFGFDGSGLVQMLCRMSGKDIPRHCQQQAELGSTINFMYEVETGDLAFFDNEEGEITHVGMILEGGKILHCSTCVSIDLLDHHGIYSNEKERYTHKLRVIKRI